MWLEPWVQMQPRAPPPPSAVSVDHRSGKPLLSCRLVVTRQSKRRSDEEIHPDCIALDIWITEYVERLPSPVKVAPALSGLDPAINRHIKQSMYSSIHVTVRTARTTHPFQHTIFISFSERGTSAQDVLNMASPCWQLTSPSRH